VLELSINRDRARRDREEEIFLELREGRAARPNLARARRAGNVLRGDFRARRAGLSAENVVSAGEKIPRARFALRDARSKEFDSAKTRARILEPSPK
jgi:hypothetical protein